MVVTGASSGTESRLELRAERRFALRVTRREVELDDAPRPGEPRNRAGLPRGEMLLLRGVRGGQEPRAFTLDERRFEVREVIDRWLAPTHRYFKVRVDDERDFILRHDADTGEWQLAGEYPVR